MTGPSRPGAMHVVAVNVGAPREIPTPNGRIVRTAIWKHPVEGRVAVPASTSPATTRPTARVHGGPDKAVYAYAARTRRGGRPSSARELGPGAFGENLTTRGRRRQRRAWSASAGPSARTVLEVRQPRLPCFKLGLRMGDPAFVRRFGRRGRPGAYLRIVREGDVGAGDAIEVVDAPGPRRHRRADGRAPSCATTHAPADAPGRAGAAAGAGATGSPSAPRPRAGPRVAGPGAALFLLGAPGSLGCQAPDRYGRAVEDWPTPPILAGTL